MEHSSEKPPWINEVTVKLKGCAQIFPRVNPRPPDSSTSNYSIPQVPKSFCMAQRLFKSKSQVVVVRVAQVRSPFL